MWDIQTGKQTGIIDTKSAVRTCNFSYRFLHQLFQPGVTEFVFLKESTTKKIIKEIMALEEIFSQ